MRKIFILFLLVFTGFVVARAQSRAQLGRMADQVAIAFSSEKMSSLDAKGLGRGRVRLTIENSIAEPEFERYRFPSFAAMGRWITKQEIDGFPARVAWPLVGCKKGVCNFFQDGGILHNHLYLTKVAYGYRNKRLYIRRIELLAG